MTCATPRWRQGCTLLALLMAVQLVGAADKCKKLQVTGYVSDTNCVNSRMVNTYHTH